MSDNLKAQFPSKCWDCEHARATWAESLEKEGLVGCSFTERYLRGSHRELFNMTDVTQIHEGWIYGGRYPLDRGESTSLGQGRTINGQPILKGVGRCTKFTQK